MDARNVLFRTTTILLVISVTFSILIITEPITRVIENTTSYTMLVNDNPRDPTSMYPSINRGDMIMFREVDVGDVNVGDIILITLDGARIAHRVQEVLVNDTTYYLVKGDNPDNSLLDYDRDYGNEIFIPHELVEGKLVANFRHLGTVHQFLQSPNQKLKIFAALLLFITALSIFLVPIGADTAGGKTMLRELLNWLRAGKSPRSVVMVLTLFLLLLLSYYLPVLNYSADTSDVSDPVFGQLVRLEPQLSQNQVPYEVVHYVVVTVNITLELVRSDYMLEMGLYRDPGFEQSVSQVMHISFDRISGTFPLSFALVIVDNPVPNCSVLYYQLRLYQQGFEQNLLRLITNTYQFVDGSLGICP